VGTASSGAVRISLADQLMEINMQPMLAQANECYWFTNTEAPWGSMETPVKSMMGMTDMQYMPMETPPDKPMMPGHAMCQQVYDESLMKAEESYGMGMPMETTMIPYRLFDSSPEKLEQEGHAFVSQSFSPESDDSPDSAAVQAPESPRCRDQDQDSLMPLMSPSVRVFASPTPATPKRPCFVPETPSPDRMHCSWLQQPTMPYGNPAPLAAMPCYFGAQAHDQVMPPPEFMQMMPGMAPHDGQVFGNLAQ
jgi:hypothetical protein